MAPKPQSQVQPSSAKELYEELQIQQDVIRDKQDELQSKQEFTQNAVENCLAVLEEHQGVLNELSAKHDNLQIQIESILTILKKQNEPSNVANVQTAAASSSGQPDLRQKGLLATPVPPATTRAHVAYLQAQVMQARAQLAQGLIDSKKLQNHQWSSSALDANANYSGNHINKISPQSSLDSIDIHHNNGDGITETYYNMQDINNEVLSSKKRPYYSQAEMGELQELALRMMRN